MRKQLTLVLMLALAIAMVGTALTYAGDRSFRSGGPRQGDALNLRDSLTEEQQTMLHGMVTEMREAGHAREAIRAAVREQLTDWGIEVPEKSGPRAGCDGPCADLTDAQRAEIRAKVQELKGNGATREEVRAAVGEMLQGWGVELPDRTGERPRVRRPGLRRLCAGLTEDQRAAIRTKVETLKAEEASPEEIRAAVREMLVEYGVELPEAAAEETAPDVTPTARIAATTAVQSASWGQIKSQMK